MEAAYRAARAVLPEEANADLVCWFAKKQAAFKGSMRINLVRMLDDIDLSVALGIRTCASLFGSDFTLLNSTSVLRYPAVRQGKNYGSSSPKVTQSPMLLRMVRQMFIQELEMCPGALVIPLGTAVTNVIQELVQKRVIDEQRCLIGLSHPSGAANGHRARDFPVHRAMLAERVTRWASSPSQ